ncbi:MAG: hypothetical protein A2Y03_02850 [Omnitrophica WOR_2 bacterium GWF2_38_59]|nr:MAG: hypothetical protein A2Y03_02850 [Omnitrophica WOR_2 bacterium GWF2_38_59]OGX48656.1 MAG: hypothetical protein A2243_09735 [Omnitrophica WOR_2 bacterium RIFOXYA2_FULL_38_17]OGX57226.1 MAG: hypothetical protein A2306_01860 [Omnitrophica WOR_2 bacterium RIFOXYB2_FULL_38_16]OGX59111.1 MAG: hypothetical protein A2447_00190 [Omnitrophica WOR_2 bacterium RIFOXYC2_FULL_38_12]HBG61306.1 hypothetical protein [Candidatus Omnitrophota bacterium]
MKNFSKRFIVVVLLLVLFSSAEAQQVPSNKEMAYKMSVIDGGRFSEKQFESVLNVLQSYFPEETYFDICYFISGTHEILQETIPSLGLYEFTLGLKNFVRDSRADTNLRESLALYGASKMSGY